MMYGSWDMECDKQPFCNFGLFFAFFPPNNPENKNFEKLKKKRLETSSFYTSVP